MRCQRCATENRFDQGVCTHCGANPTTGLPPRTSTLAVVGLVFAILFPIAGFIISLAARSEIDRSYGAVAGRGVATAGLWLSVISFVVGFAALTGA